jgi:hypothetical protein
MSKDTTVQGCDATEDEQNYQGWSPKKTTFDY